MDAFEHGRGVREESPKSLENEEEVAADRKSKRRTRGKIFEVVEPGSERDGGAPLSGLEEATVDGGGKKVARVRGASSPDSGTRPRTPEERKEVGAGGGSEVGTEGLEASSANCDAVDLICSREEKRVVESHEEKLPELGEQGESALGDGRYGGGIGEPEGAERGERDAGIERGGFGREVRNTAREAGPRLYARKVA